MKVLIGTIGTIALFFWAIIAFAQTETENARTIAELNRAMETQKMIISNLVNRLENLETQPSPQADGLTREEILKLLEKETVEYLGPTHKMLVHALLAVAFQGTDLEDREEAVEGEYLRLLQAKKAKEGNDFLLKAVSVAMAKKKVQPAVVKEAAEKSVPDRDERDEFERLKKEVAVLVDFQNKMAGRLDGIDQKIKGIDQNIKTSAKNAEARLAEYDKKIERMNQAIGKKAESEKVDSVVSEFQKWQDEVGGDMYSLADGMLKLAENQKKGMRTKTVPILDPVAGFFGHQRPVKLTKDGEKTAAQVEKSAAEMLKRWERYKK